MVFYSHTTREKGYTEGNTPRENKIVDKNPNSDRKYLTIEAGKIKATNRRSSLVHNMSPSVLVVEKKRERESLTPKNSMSTEYLHQFRCNNILRKNWSLKTM